MDQLWPVHGTAPSSTCALAPFCPARLRMCSKPIAWLWETKLAESNPFSRQCDVSGAHMTTTISNEKAPDTGESKTLELPVGEPRSSVRGHCLWAQKKVPIDAPLRPLAYDRMFPDLPPFRADEDFLRALGRVDGVCDCGRSEDSPESLGDTAAGWPIFGQFVAHDITADRSVLRFPYQHERPTQCTESATQPGVPLRRRTGWSSISVSVERSSEVSAWSRGS